MKIPNLRGYFGEYGGMFVPETLVSALKNLEKEFNAAWKDRKFHDELSCYLKNYAGRPTPLYFAGNLSKHLNGLKIYLKREDLCHTGSHKLNNVIGQVLLAKKLNKTRVIAETGAGQHGVATATVATLFGMKCDIYMGEEDVKRQEMNVFRMQLLGATVIPVKSGSKTLKDAINECLRDWVTNVNTTYYVFGTVAGPHPYPLIVRNFQSIIGKETKKQIMAAEHKLPDYLIACVGGGSNAIGLFHPFYNNKQVKFIGVEAAGLGANTNKTAATLNKGTPGILHGSNSYILQDKYGQIIETHSISAGLDYPGVGPEHSFYKDTRRAEYVSATDSDALLGFHTLTKNEGIIPALESSHAVGYLVKHKSRFKKNSIIIINVSGRGDKDINIVKQHD